jgi:hypothetical protein
MAAEIRTALARRFNVPSDELDSCVNLATCTLLPLTTVVLAMDLERLTGIELAIDDLETVQTVGDLSALFCERVRNAAGTPAAINVGALPREDGPSGVHPCFGAN